MDVSEGGSAGEGTSLNLRELLVGVKDFLGLCVKTGRIDIGVINTILLSSGHTELELKKDTNLSELLEVSLADTNVLLKRFLRKIKHVGREEGFTSGGEVLLRSGEETVDPREPGLLAMISVKNDGNSVKLGNLVDVLGSSDGSSNGGRVSLVGERLSGNELSTTLGEGDHDGSSVLGGGFHTGVDGVGSYDVDSGDGVSLFLGGIEKVGEGLSGDNTWLDGGRELGESLS